MGSAALELHIRDLSTDHAARPGGCADANRLTILFDSYARSFRCAASAPEGDCVTSGLRTLADLERAVRALCFHFETDAIVIVGSQAILAIWPDAPALLRRSGEIDAYPANAREWQIKNQGMEASEEVFALFGEASPFHLAHGFYIDGVDETTRGMGGGGAFGTVRPRESLSFSNNELTLIPR